MPEEARGVTFVASRMSKESPYGDCGKSSDSDEGLLERAELCPCRSPRLDRRLRSIPRNPSLPVGLVAHFRGMDIANLVTFLLNFIFGQSWIVTSSRPPPQFPKEVVPSLAIAGAGAQCSEHPPLLCLALSVRERLHSITKIRLGSSLKFRGEEGVFREGGYRGGGRP